MIKIEPAKRLLGFSRTDFNFKKSDVNMLNFKDEYDILVTIR